MAMVIASYRSAAHARPARAPQVAPAALKMKNPAAPAQEGDVTRQSQL
jgi:hypothetical protein